MSRILLLEGDLAYAARLQHALTVHGELDISLAHRELAVVRHLAASPFDLLVVGIRHSHRKEGWRLLELLLSEQRAAAPPPIIVLSEERDPIFIRRCIKLGVSDYVLYADNPSEVVPRLLKCLQQAGCLARALLQAGTQFLGPAAGVFLERHARAQLKVAGLHEVQPEQLPAFLSYLAIKAQPILKDRAEPFIRQLEQAGGVQREA